MGVCVPHSKAVQQDEHPQPYRVGESEKNDQVFPPVANTRLKERRATFVQDKSRGWGWEFPQL